MLNTRDAEAPAAPIAMAATVKVTRDGLLDGSLLAAARAFIAREGIDVHLRSDAEIDALVDQSIAAQPSPSNIWVFAYGSLMWNPTFLYAERCRVVLQDWHREFCAWSPIGRGSRKHPALTLALEQGGSTEGIAYRLPRGKERTELTAIFRREMLSDDYIPRWMDVGTCDGPVHAMSFVANPHSKRYAGGLPEAEVAAAIASACGRVGTAADYLQETIAHLNQIGLRDEKLARIHRLVQARTLA